MKRHAPAALRNREPILEVLREVLPPRGLVLEIASGSGEHAVHFARAFPALEWQPSDLDPGARASVDAHAEEAGLSNLRPAISLDASAPTWPLAHADAIVSINMIHIAPWEACLGLLAGAARLLDEGAPLYLYGPFFLEDVPTAESNLAFDARLRQEDPAWGVREASRVIEAARGFVFERRVAMPANNVSLVLRRAMST